MPPTAGSAAPSVVSIGECMVELARGTDGRFGLAYGGDTFNTAVYLARAGLRVAYATALGDDPYSQGILDLARTEGIDTGLVHIALGRMPGLYLIETTPDGERSFHYWRDRAPARELLDGPGAEAVISALRGASVVYLSGITLSLYAPSALDRLADGLARARDAGARIAMDGNYRPRGWGGDKDRARATLERFWRLADIGLPTFDDESLLWDDDAPDETLSRLAGLGVPEIVVKEGGEGALCTDGRVEVNVKVPERIVPVDTTAAGDSFNAGYLAARLSGRDLIGSALAGHRLAGAIIQHRGAIVPRAATDAALKAS